MLRYVKKPKEVNFRKHCAAIIKMNKNLIYFPNASKGDKFSDMQILEILEWSCPYHWKAQFDYKGYVPTEHNKARLIQEAEIIEQADALKPRKMAGAKNNNKMTNGQN